MPIAKLPAAGWAQAGKLPFTVTAMPLESSRDAARWIERAMAVDSEFAIVDCPPHVGDATGAAIGIADLVLMPIYSSGADLRATVQALELLRAARSKRDGKPAALLVPSRIDRRTSVGREIESALKQFGEPIGPPILQRVDFIDCCTESRWIGDFAPESAAHDDITALTLAVRRRLK